MTSEPIDIVLIGGARDGLELTITATEWLVLPRLVDVHLHALWMTQQVEASGADGPIYVQDIYRRDVISDVSHRWRYVLER